MNPLPARSAAVRVGRIPSELRRPARHRPRARSMNRPAAWAVLRALLAPISARAQHAEHDDVEVIQPPKVRPAADEKKPDLANYYAVQMFGRPKSQAIEFTITN